MTATVLYRGLICGYPAHGRRLSGEKIDNALLVEDRKSTRLNSSHSQISYAVFCLKEKNRHAAVGHPAAGLEHGIGAHTRVGADLGFATHRLLHHRALPHDAVHQPRVPTYSGAPSD